MDIPESWNQPVHTWPDTTEKMLNVLENPLIRAAICAVWMSETEDKTYDDARTMLSLWNICSKTLDKHDAQLLMNMYLRYHGLVLYTVPTEDFKPDPVTVL